MYDIYIIVVIIFSYSFIIVLYNYDDDRYWKNIILITLCNKFIKQIYFILFIWIDKKKRKK